MMNGTLTTGRIPFYVIGCVAAALFIVVCTRLEYDNTFLVTYVESGVRRVGLAEKLRKIPLSFFGKKDLADLTYLHYERLCRAGAEPIPLCRAAVWRDPLHYGHRRVDAVFQLAHGACRHLAAARGVCHRRAGIRRAEKALPQSNGGKRFACEDGIQECMEAMPDLRANNAESAYLAGLEKKIRAVESRLVKSELGTAVFVVSAGLVLRLGIATTAPSRAQRCW